MAHPKYSVITSRKVLTASMTTALLLVPLAAPAAALGLTDTLEDADKSLLDDVDETTQSLNATVDGLVKETEKVVKDTVETVKDVVEPVKEAAEPVVEPVKEAVPAPAPSPEPSGGSDDESSSKSSGGSSSGGVRSAGGVTPIETSSGGSSSGGTAAGSTTRTPATPQDVTRGQSSLPSASGDRAAGGPNLQPLRQGYRSQSDLNLQPATPPIVSAPFAYETPVVADDMVPVPTIPSMSALETTFAPVAAAAATTLPTGVPGSLVATATGMLVLLGGAHVLHRAGRLGDAEA